MGSMMPVWHQLVPMSGHVEESETARKLQLYATSIKTFVSTRLYKTAVRGHSFVHKKAGQNSKSMANVFVSQKYLTEIQLAQLTLLKNNYYSNS